MANDAKKAKKSVGFSEFEKAAIRDRARELAAEAKISKNRALGESEVLKAIAAMPEPDRSMGRKIHDIVRSSAPKLSPKTWYGMPAYADRDGKVVCFFQSAFKFKARYATFGFNDTANLDEGNMWPASFALKKLTAAEEKKIAELVKKAVA